MTQHEDHANNGADAPADSAAGSEAENASGPQPQSGEGELTVEDILNALANGLQHDRERRVLAGDGEQLRRPLALLPQRLAPAGIAAWQQQRPSGALPEPGGEQRRPTDLLGHQVGHLAGIHGQCAGQVESLAVLIEFHVG